MIILSFCCTIQNKVDVNDNKGKTKRKFFFPRMKIVREKFVLMFVFVFILSFNSFWKERVSTFCNVKISNYSDERCKESLKWHKFLLVVEQLDDDCMINRRFIYAFMAIFSTRANTNACVWDRSNLDKKFKLWCMVYNNCSTV